MAIGLSEVFIGTIQTIQGFYSSMIYLERCLFLMNKVPREDDQLPEEEYCTYSSHQVHPIPGDNESQVELVTVNSLNIQPVWHNAIQINNLYAKYRDDLEIVLKDVSLTLKPGERVEIHHFILKFIIR